MKEGAPADSPAEVVAERPSSRGRRRLGAGAGQAGRFLLRAALLIPLYALLGLACLASAALLFARGMDGGWAALGGWSLLTAYAAAGLVGGGLLGGITAAGRTLDAFEDGARGWLPALPAGPDPEGFPRLPLEELRGAYERVLDEMVERTLGRLRLPRALRRLARSRLRQAAVEDFVGWCEARGASPVGAPEFRTWVLERGLALALRQPRLQLRLWRGALLGVLGLLVAVAIALRFLE